jgi:Zn-dependent protease with chaperone function
MGVRLGQLFFLVIDRWTARRIEFRADREAVAHFGVSPGVDVMKKLGGGGEPLFGGLFATHPKIAERIVKMREKK